MINDDHVLSFTGVLAFLGICCLAVVIALFVGLGKVLAYIAYTERIKESGSFTFFFYLLRYRIFQNFEGLYLIPEPMKTQDSEFIPFCVVNTPEKKIFRACNNNTIQTYIDQINDKLERKFFVQLVYTG